MLTLLVAVALQGPIQHWQFVRPGILCGIGGMALIGQADDRVDLLVVHDNKKDGEARAGVVTLHRGNVPTYREVAWKGTPLPVDLEYLSPIPGKSNVFLAGTSAGDCWLVEWDGEALHPRQGFKLPDVQKGANFEGAHVQTLDEKTWLVWGHRGSRPEKAYLRWCEFDLQAGYPRGPVSGADLDVPWPAAVGARGISDIKVDSSGTVFAAGAMDSGDDGPFQSVFFVAGVLRPDSPTMKFTSSPGYRLMWTDQHKIEAIELVPGKFGGLVLATDDENLGSYVWSNLWP